MRPLRSLPLRLLLFAILAWFTLSALTSPLLPPVLKLIVGATIALSFVSPVSGLLAVAVLTPFSNLLTVSMDREIFRMSEALVVAFLAGWVLRTPDNRRGPRMPAHIGWLVALTIIASIGAQAWRLHHDYPGELSRVVEQLSRVYYLTGDPIGFIAGARLLEGLALMVATVALFRNRPALAMWLPAALAIPAALAALASILLWRGIAPAAVLARHVKIGYRVSAHIPDFNAAGSYFALMLCLMLGMAIRVRGIRSAAWLAAAAACGAGLWLSESRSAFGSIAVVVLLSAMWFVSVDWKIATRLIALTTLLVAALAVGGIRARQLERDVTYRGTELRRQFNATSLRMIGTRPLFGVGVGQYYPTSPLFLSPQLAWIYGHENAHNYMLQVAGELGLLGLGILATFVGVHFRRVGRALMRAPRDARLLGAIAGTVALLGTSLTGHPLLVDEVGFPFWIVFGLTVALAESTLLNAVRGRAMPHAAHRPWAGAASAVAVVVIAAAVASARSAPIDPPASAAVDGFHGWETDSDGGRFRWSHEYASLFVPADVRRLHVPVRLPTDRRPIAPMGVEIAVGGVHQSRTMAVDAWGMIDVVLPRSAPPTRFTRVDLKVDQTWQPALFIPGNSDMRRVGVQVGECELVR